jgi:DNA replication and repair protein RecF
VWLTTVSHRGLRNLVPATLEFGQGINWIVGPNGAGKSSVLESVSLLATSRSFRGAEVGPIVQFGQSALLVSGKVCDQDGRLLQLGVSRSRTGETIAKRDGELLRRSSELARVLPSYVFDAGAIQRLYQGSAGRRALLDWGVFHVERDSGDVSRSWRHALANRNALLKARDGSQLGFWDERFIETSKQVEALRREYFAAWLPYVNRIAEEFGLSGVRISYRQGWAADDDLADVLERTRDQDLNAGRTTHGPQRSDVRLASEIGLARETLSRGQQKALAAALVLGQLFVRRGTTGARPIALIDDLVAELDSQRAAAVIALLRNEGVQTFCAVIDLPTELVNRGEDVVIRLVNGQPESA